MKGGLADSEAGALYFALVFGAGSAPWKSGHGPDLFNLSLQLPALISRSAMKAIVGASPTPTTNLNVRVIETKTFAISFVLSRWWLRGDRRYSSSRKRSGRWPEKQTPLSDIALSPSLRGVCLKHGIHRCRIASTDRNVFDGVRVPVDRKGGFVSTRWKFRRERRSPEGHTPNNNDRIRGI